MNPFVLSTPATERANHVRAFEEQIKKKSDKLMNQFLIVYFLVGLALAPFFNTWLVAIGVGGLSLIAYFSTKWALPDSNLYQYVLAAVLGVFMAQYIYQMHGLFEMHFVAFISSAMLITYQNWKLQLPLAAVVTIHHAIFGYLQFLGFSHVYFTRLEYMDLQTFIIHVLLAAVIFGICGLWAYQFKNYSTKSIRQTFEMGRLQEAAAQKELLERANTELKKSNMELDKFTYCVSHDLRAPLSSMLGIIEISEIMTQEPVIQKHMGMMKKSINKLDAFILDILAYSRNTRLDIKKEEIDFKEILNDITDGLKYMNGTAREVDIKINVTDEAAFVSDKTRLSVVMNNLVSNAIRYQNPAVPVPFVGVDVTTSENEAVICVKDNGIGISREHQDKIFEMFYRVSDNSVGSGLGLYIVKETVDKLKGHIEIESEPGKGTTFNIHIPNNHN